MKRIIALLVVLTFSISYPQNLPEQNSFHHIGFYGGINFNTADNVGGNFLIQYNIFLTSNLNLNLSAGYLKSIKPEFYNVRTYSKVYIGNLQHYNYLAESYNVTGDKYYMVPISVGLQYIFIKSLFSPYLLANFSYSFINTLLDENIIYSTTYNSLNDIPAEYKTQYLKSLPGHSSGVGIGLGTYYSILPDIALDFRYMYNINGNIINTNNFIIGISF